MKPVKLCAVAVAMLSVPALAQAQRSCAPACRSGFVCISGKCISACNPPCPAGEVCVGDGECVPANTSPQPSAAPAPQPLPAAAPRPLPVAAGQTSCETTADCGQGTACIAGTCAPFGTPSPGPVDTAKAGILTGLVFDLVGYAMILIGGAISGVSPGAASVGLGLAVDASIPLSAGAVIGTLSYSLKSSAYDRAGFDVRGGPKVAAWTLTGVTLAFTVGGVGMGMAGLASQSIALLIVGACVTLVADICEIINMLIVRPKWEAAILAAPRKAQQSSSMSVFPVAFVARTQDSGRAVPVFGLGGSF